MRHGPWYRACPALVAAPAGPVVPVRPPEFHPPGRPGRCTSGFAVAPMADSKRPPLRCRKAAHRPPCTGPAADASSLRDHFLCAACGAPGLRLGLHSPPRPSLVMPADPLSPIDIARLEEARQAHGVAEAAGYAEAV